MTADELKKKYFDFFEKKGHKIILSAPLVPENDPTALYISAGMQPLVPYLLGEPHPEGKRVSSAQKCVRTGDIDEVGDTTHHTFFEMLGNWSFGDYWKYDAISWSYEFLTKDLDLDPEKLWVTCFAGDKDAPKDVESAKIWESLGIPKDRIYFYGKKDNWWGPAGETGPCGPDTEMFYEITGKSHGADCKPGDNCGRFFEIWNDVFMQYNKTSDGKYEPLKQKNVDTGMGVDRTVTVLSGLDDDYQVKDLWGDILKSIGNISKTDYSGSEKAHRVIADHIRAATFIVADGVIPSNKDRGYILRRLIRRAVRYGRSLGMKDPFMGQLSKTVVTTYKKNYPELEESSKKIQDLIGEEEEKFLSTLDRGLREVGRLEKLDGKSAFYLYETYGFPLELSEEIAEEKGQKIDRKQFEKEFEKHRELSRTASAGMFKGGLADHSGEVTKLHTATHLLHASLRKVLGEHVQQKGSNITAERLRFDFTHKEKLTRGEIKKVERLINDAIEQKLPVSSETMTLRKAKDKGAIAFFGEKYGEKVKVYTVGPSADPLQQDSGQAGSPFSREVCGGPHVKNTSEIGRVRIKKQEKIGSGLIRVYAVIKNGRS